MRVIELMISIWVVVRFTEVFADDMCGERVALKELNRFSPLENRTELVRIEVTDQVEVYTKIATYVGLLVKILEGQQTTMAAGRPDCDEMYFWTDKHLCLMKTNADVNDAPWECAMMGFTIYQPMSNIRDMDLFRKLAKKGITYVPAVLDASGRSVFNQEGEFVLGFAKETFTADMIKEVDANPIAVSLNKTSGNKEELIANSVDKMPAGTRVLCESQPLAYEKDNPMQPVYRTTMEEFLERASELISNLQKQYEVGDFVEPGEIGHQLLELRLSGLMRTIMENTYRMSEYESWQDHTTASLLYPTLREFDRLPLSQDGVNYKIDAKDVKRVKSVFNLKANEYLDHELRFELNKVEMEGQKRFAYGRLTARLASTKQILTQYQLMPYNFDGQIVDERFMYEWDENYFVSSANVEFERGCSHRACDLDDFLETLTGRDESCANFLMGVGSGELNCRYKDHPWPVAYRLVCNESVTSIVSSPEKVSLNVHCGSLQSKDVIFPKGKTDFVSICGILLNGFTLLPLEEGLKNGVKYMPPSYVDPESDDYFYHLLYSGMGLLFAIALVSAYSLCRIFRGQPFCCCERMCPGNCVRIPRYVDDCDDNISTASGMNRRRPTPIIRTTRDPTSPNAPPLNYIELANRSGGFESHGGLGNQGALGQLEAHHSGAYGGRVSGEGSMAGVPMTHGSMPRGNQFGMDPIEPNPIL